MKFIANRHNIISIKIILYYHYNHYNTPHLKNNSVKGLVEYLWNGENKNILHRNHRDTPVTCQAP